jgi:hypothetical protein
MRSHAEWVLVCGLAGLLASSAVRADQTKQAPPPTPPAAAGNALAVTVNYTGKGVVDAAHEILVVLFSDPNIGNDSRPLNLLPATKNGQTVTFTGLGTSPVYVVVVYNETGNYHGRGGPPPAGTPYGTYAKDAKSPPTAVTPGPKTAIKVSFSGAQRWK